MAHKLDGQSNKKTRRQALAVGLAAVAGAGAGRAAGDAQAAADSAEPWTPKKQAVRRPGQPASANSLLSSCIRSGHLLFVAGIGGWYPDRRKEPGEGYRGFFPDPPPARSYSGGVVGQMGRDGVLVQIDCIAYVD